MIRIRRPHLQIVVMVLAALSFVLLGAAHRLPGGMAQSGAYSGAEIAAYMLPDGTLPDLCNPSVMGDEIKGGMGCPACLLAKSITVGEPLLLPLPSGRVIASDNALHSDADLQGHGPRAPPARGPPLARLA